MARVSSKKSAQNMFSCLQDIYENINQKGLSVSEISIDKFFTKHHVGKVRRSLIAFLDEREPTMRDAENIRKACNSSSNQYSKIKGFERFREMMKAIKDDICNGRVTIDNLHLQTYQNVYGTKRFAKKFIADFDFSSDMSDEILYSFYNKISNHYVKRTMKLRSKKSYKGCNYDNEHMDYIPIKDEEVVAQLTEEDCIRFLKDRGYKIYKTQIVEV